MTNLNKIKVAILGSPKVGKSGKQYSYVKFVLFNNQ